MSPEEFASKSFDYVIVGGGTAGLTLAARLSENEDITVGVLEAGRSHLNDPLVETPGLHGQLLGQEIYDWQFQTVEQVILSIAPASRRFE
jgi:choline dehydrogenase